MSDKKYEFTGETMVTNGDAWVLGDARVLGDAQVHGTDLRKISLFLDPTTDLTDRNRLKRGQRADTVKHDDAWVHGKCMGPRLFANRLAL